MRNLKRIALLIDADNTQLSKLEDVIQEISTHGRIVVKRAYGNWKKNTLKNWESEIMRLAIRPQQQFDYTSGKNATDMALVIDTISLLHKDLYDGFVIVASDSDYTPLAITLHESGVYVIGVGEKKTPEAFRNSCDEFIFLENLNTESEKSAKKGDAGNEKAKGNAPEAEETIDNNDSTNDINEIHKLLKIASDKFQDDDGYVNVSLAGQYIKRAKPDFDVRTFGFIKLTKLLEAFPEKYMIKKPPGKGKVTIIAYKCK